MLNQLKNIYRLLRRRLRPVPLAFVLRMLLLTCWGFNASAQNITVTGKVIDAATHEALSFVGVNVKNTNVGATADSAGNFKLNVTLQYPYIQVSVIGYERKLLKVEANSTSPVIIELKSAGIDIKEVVVKQPKKQKRLIDTAALYVLARVLQHKKDNNPKAIPGYSLRQHSKMVASLIHAPAKFTNAKVFKPYAFFLEKRDTTVAGEEFIPLAIMEEYNETYHRATPALDRKVIYYRRLSGAKKGFIPNYLATQFATIDIYEHVFEIANKLFPSPFAPTARATYVYHIIDTLRTGTGVSYKLNFVAKNKEDVALKGYAVVDSATWGISNIYFMPNPKANLNFLTEYTVEQQFTNTGTGWIMQQEKLTARGNLLEQKDRMSVYITKLTMCDGIQLSPAMPDKVNRAADDIVVKDAYKQHRSYLDTLRISPLTETEQHIYHSFDTIVTLSAFKKLQWLAHLVTTGTLRAGPIDFGPLQYAVSRNAVEGYRVRMGAFTNERFSRIVYLYAHAAYGFTDKKWKYQADMRIKLPDSNNRWNQLWFESKSDMIMLGYDNPLLAYDNVLSLLSLRSKYTKVLHVMAQSLQYQTDWLKGFSTSLGVSFIRYYSTERGFTFVQYNGDAQPVAGFNTTELSAELRYSANSRYTESYGRRNFILTNKPAFTFKYTWGIKNPLTGNYAYHKLQAGVQQLIYMPVVGHGKLNVNIGVIFGNAPYPVAFISGANQDLFRDESAYQLTRQVEFGHDKFLSVWYQHHFDGLLFNHIPYINKAKLREFISVKALWGGMKATNKTILQLPAGMHTTNSGPYVEVGFGIENILKVIQVSCNWRATYRNTADAANFAVKIAIKPSF